MMTLALGVLALCFGLIAPPSPDRIPRPTDKGELQLKELVGKCVEAGAIQFLPSTKLGERRISVKDPKKLAELLAQNRALITEDLCETLIAMSLMFDQSELLEAIAKSQNDPRMLAFAAKARGDSLRDQGDDPAALKSYESADALFKKLPAPGWQIVNLQSWAKLLAKVNEPTRAHEKLVMAVGLLSTAEVVREEIGDLYSSLGDSHRTLQDSAKARAAYERALQEYGEAKPEVPLKIVEVLLSLATLAMEDGDNARTLSLFDQAETQALKAQDAQQRQKKIGVVQANRAEYLHQSGRIAEARASYEKSLATFHALDEKPHALIANVQFSLGALLFNASDRNAGIKMVHESLLARRDLYGDRDECVIDSHQQLGVMLVQDHQFSGAREHFEEAQRITELLFGAKHPKMAETLAYQADLASEQGDFRRAGEIQQRRLQILLDAEAASPDSVASAWNALGIEQFKLKDYPSALKSFETARALWSKQFGSEHPNVLSSWKNSALVSTAMGNKADALKAYEAILEAREKTVPHNPVDIADSLNALGSYYYDLADYKQSRDYHERAAAQVQSQPTVSTYVRCATLNNLAMANYGLRDWKAAISAFDQALSYRRIHPSETQPRSDATRADAAAAAIEFLPEDLIADGLNVQILLSRGMAQQHLARQSKVYRDYMEASYSYVCAMATLENWRVANLMSEEARLRSATDLGDVFPLLIGLHEEIIRQELPKRPDVLEGSQEIAFRAAEASSGRNFQRTLAQSKVNVLLQLPEELLTKHQDLIAQGELIDRQLATHQASVPGNRDFKKIDTLLGERRRNKLALQEWEQEVKTNYPKYSELLFPPILKSAEAKDCLQFDEVAITYVVGSAQSYAVLYDPSSSQLAERISIVVLPPERALKELVLSLGDRAQLVAPVNQDSIWREAYDVLLAPMAQRIAGKKLVIIPGGCLASVPFEALVSNFDKANGQPQYLIQQNSVRYAPSLGSLRYLRLWNTKRVKPTKPLLAFGDPQYPEATQQQLPRLVHSGDEVRQAARQLGADDRSILLGASATKDRLMAASHGSELDNVRFVHFATHGLLGSNESPEPCIVLAHADPNRFQEAKLGLRDIVELRLNADLVVLSACHSARGQQFEGEGTHGLARAFLIAGSEAVLSSLWGLEDSTTAEFMHEFYKRLVANTDAVEALRQCKINMIDQGQPILNWAGLVLTGG